MLYVDFSAADPYLKKTEGLIKQRPQSKMRRTRVEQGGGPVKRMGGGERRGTHAGTLGPQRHRDGREALPC